MSFINENTTFMLHCNPFIGLWTPSPQGSVTAPHDIIESYIFLLDL